LPRQPDCGDGDVTATSSSGIYGRSFQPGIAEFTSCSGFLTAHRLFDQSDDHHQNASPDTAGGNLPDN